MNNQTTMEGQLDRRTNNFDLLRLLAAWFVLFSHCYPLSGQPVADPFVRHTGIDTLGGIGVSIFFVLSGYLVTNSLERSSSVYSFARKRAFRIFPALAVLTVYCSYWLGPVLTTLPLETYLKHPQTVAYLWNVSAWKIQYALPGVFATNPVPVAVNGSLWSLPYEISCYLALTTLWLLRIPRRAAVTGAVMILSYLLYARPPMPPATAFDKYSLWLGAALVGVSLAMNHSHEQTAVFVFGFAVFVLALGSRPGLLPRLPEKWAIGPTVCFWYGFPVQQVLAMFGLASAGVAAFAIASTAISLACGAIVVFGREACTCHRAVEPLTAVPPLSY
ncbi:MAG: acyltransferase [Comamonadaceae bacterium]|nr:acyltransferase [Comamonadaceae bacterium]